MAWENPADVESSKEGKKMHKNGIFSDPNKPELVVFLQETDFRYHLSNSSVFGSKNASSNLPSDEQKAVSINTLEDLLKKTEDYGTRHSCGEEQKNVAQEESSSLENGFRFHQVQCPGNVSHRSNSSTASSGSFAFPILASEWNGSPARMAEPEKRQLRKRRWRKIWFFCGKF